MALIMIAAIGMNGELGYNNKLLIRIPEDMKHFKELTKDAVVVMGSKTYASIGKPLSGRQNIILTRNPLKYQKTIERFAENSNTSLAAISDANEVIELSKERDVYVIGGSELYNIFINSAKSLQITQIYSNFKECDRYFPKWNEIFVNRSKSKEMEYYDEVSGHTYRYDFQEWVRKDAVEAPTEYDKKEQITRHLLEQDGTDINSQIYKTPEALDMLFSGIDIKMTAWSGYLRYNADRDIVEMVNMINNEIQVKTLKVSKSEMIARYRGATWVVATSANTPALGGTISMSYGDALKELMDEHYIQAEYMPGDIHLEIVRNDIMSNDRPIGTEESIALFNGDRYVSYYVPSQLDIFCKWKLWSR